MPRADSIERERKEYAVILLSTVGMAILIQFIPSLYFQGIIFPLTIVVILLGVLMITLFIIIVKPRRWMNEFLTVLIYDLDKNSFLPTGFYAFLANQLYREPNKNFINQEAVVAIFKGAEDKEFAKNTERLVQALLVEWLNHIVSQSELPLARRSRLLLTPLPTRLLQKGVSFSKELPTEVKILNPREITKNPYMTDMASIALPKSTNLEFFENGLRLISKKVKINLTVRFVGIQLSPSTLTYHYFEYIQRIFKHFFREDLPQRKLVEVICVVTFRAELSRFAKDAQLNWANEMAGSLEDFLHWDRVLELMAKTRF